MKRTTEPERPRPATSRRSFGALGLGLLVAWSATGCVSTPAGIPVVEGRELPDIPVMKSYELVESSMYDPPVPEAGKFRSWTGLYKGPGLTGEIGPWYVGAMTRHGWEFTGATQSDRAASYTYTFVKNDEEAEIRVTREYSFNTGKSVNLVRAEVRPRGTETFLTEHLDTLKATGTQWTRQEPRPESLQPVSFPRTSAADATERADAGSDFLLEPLPEEEEEEEAPGETP